MTCAEGAVTARSPFQVEGDGLIPISALHIRPVEWTVARAFINEHHYLHRSPRRDFGDFLGIFDGSEWTAPLVGMMIWMYPTAANRLHRGWTTFELRRMVILDVTERNAESRCLGYAARYLRTRRPHLTDLIAYSDIDGMGHEGTIYKAAGWTFDGETKPIAWSNRLGRKNKGSTTRKLRWRKELREE